MSCCCCQCAIADKFIPMQTTHGCGVCCLACFRDISDYLVSCAGCLTYMLMENARAYVAFYPDGQQCGGLHHRKMKGDTPSYEFGLCPTCYWLLTTKEQRQLTMVMEAVAHDVLDQPRTATILARLSRKLAQRSEKLPLCKLLRNGVIQLRMHARIRNATASWWYYK